MKLFLVGGPASPQVCVWALLLILAVPALAQQPDDILKLGKRMVDLQLAGKHAEALPLA